MIQYTQSGCPMCQVLKDKQDGLDVKYRVETDQAQLLSKGITHVPMLETDDGMMLNVQQALGMIDGLYGKEGSHVR